MTAERQLRHNRDLLLAVLSTLLTVGLWCHASTQAAVIDIQLVAKASPSGSDTASAIAASDPVVKRGTALYVEVWAQTSNANGLSSVSMDMTFNPAVATAQSITHTVLFQELPVGTLNNVTGLVDNLSGSHLGPCSDAVGVAPNWGRVAVINMTANALGTLILQAGPTGNAAYRSAVCGVSDFDPSFGSRTIQVVLCVLDADCTDGLFCNGAETCNPVTYVCQPGTAPTCDDGNVCTNDSCNSVKGCVHVNNTLLCNDGDACTTNDTCSGGVCVGGAPPNCDDGNPCTDDTCDPDSECRHFVNTGPCNDGNACTTGDTCSGGSCLGGPPPNCDDGNVCTTDACDPATGCTHTNNNVKCSDGNACTSDDTCSGGSCVGGPSLICNDANVCTNDSCATLTGCVHANNNNPCDDGNACTSGDLCVGGVCTGTPISGCIECTTDAGCNDGNGCTNDSCDAFTGCVFTNNTNSCNDANACTTGDTCSAGSCVGGPPLNCNDGNGCTNDSCNPLTGCVFTNNTNSCNDANACTTNDTCSAGSCVGGPPLNCDDGNLCTNGSCAPLTGCVHANNTVPCNDGNACTTGDTCSAGSCVGGPPPNCDDDNVCTDDFCDTVSGCVNADNSDSCDDGNACTTNDTCSGGSCLGGPPLNCNDGNGCTTDACQGGRCVFTNNINSCNDANACTTNDTCSGGVCVGGAPPNCDDGNVCTDDFCDVASGCVHANNSNSCDDAALCTVSDVCAGGVCLGGAPRPCNDGLFCNGLEFCDPVLACLPGTAPCGENACLHCKESSAACEWCILDLDLNGVAGTGDFAAFAGCYATCPAAANPCFKANFDGSGCVGTSDFAAFAGCFGFTCGECAGCAGPAAASTASVSNMASSEPVVAIQLAIVTEPSSGDFANSPPRSIRTAMVGQTLLVEVWAIRADESLEDARGLAAAYVDVSYDPRLLSIMDVRPSAHFALFPDGYDESGILRAVGGCALLGERSLGTDGTWVRVATVTARADAPGTGTLRANTSDPIHGIALVGEFANVDLGRIDFDAVDLVVKPKDRAVREGKTR